MIGTTVKFLDGPMHGKGVILPCGITVPDEVKCTGLDGVSHTYTTFGPTSPCEDEPHCSFYSHSSIDGVETFKIHSGYKN